MAKRLLALGPILALALGACGGDEGTSKEDFVAKTDAICRDVKPRYKAVQRRRPTALQGLPDYFQRVQRLVDDAVARMEAVPLPSDKEDRRGAQAYVRAFKGLSEPLNEIRQDSADLRAAIAARDRDRVEQIGARLGKATQEIQGSGDRADEIARDYGIKECAEF